MDLSTLREATGIRCLRVEEAAQLLRVNKSSIYRRIESGELPCIFVGCRKVILLEDLQEFIEKQRVGARGRCSVGGSRNGNCNHR